MTGKTHAVIGANTVWLLKLTTVKFNPLLIPLAMVAALLPDLDASESSIKHLYIPLGSGRNTVKVQPFYLPALIFSRIFKHRGWLHSGVAIIVVGMLSTVTLGRFGVAYPLFVTLGYASHLVSDAMTISGIQFFLPGQRPLHLLPRGLRIRTGGAVDMLLFVIGALGLGLLVKYFVPVSGVITSP